LLGSSAYAVIVLLQQQRLHAGALSGVAPPGMNSAPEYGNIADNFSADAGKP